LLVEESRTNLLTYSENFDNAVWAKVGSTILPNHSVALDGSLSENRFVPDTSTGYHYISKTITHGQSATLCGSIYISKESTESCRIQLWNGTDASIASVDFTPGTGVINSTLGAIARIEDLGTKYRVIVGGTTTTTATALRVFGGFGGQYTGDGVSYLGIWGVQLEQGSFPTSYIPSTETFTSRASTATYYDSTGTLQTAAIDTARISYNPADLSAPGKLLLEGASTNLSTDSELIAASEGINVTSNTINAPDGLLTADLITEQTTTGEHFAQDTIKEVTAGLTYTWSCFVKDAPSADRELEVRVAGENRATTVFDPRSKTSVIEGGTGGFTELPNGYFRVWVTFTALVTGSTVFRLQLLLNNTRLYTGVLNSGLYIWGAQLEESPYPTSYIPTTTAQVTRSADVSSSAQTTRVGDVVNHTLGDEFNPNEFSIYLHVKVLGYSNNQWLYALVDSSGNRLLGYYTNTTSAFGIATDNTFKFCISLASDNTYAIHIDGSLHESGTDTTDFSDAVVIRMLRANVTTGGSFGMMNGMCKDFQVFPKALSSAEAIALTS
jgi:hypothetical protein